MLLFESCNTSLLTACGTAESTNQDDDDDDGTRKWKLDDNDVVFRGLVYARELDAEIARRVDFDGGVLAEEVRVKRKANTVRWIDPSPPTLTFLQPTKEFLSVGDFDLVVEVTDQESGIGPSWRCSRRE